MSVTPPRYDNCPDCGGRKRGEARRCRACHAIRESPTEAKSRDRLLKRLDMTGGPDACWWLTRNRRPLFYVNGAQIMANRATYMLLVGPIPAGVEVCHTCDNPRCCNPAHLWLGTHLDNMRDMAAKGRGRNGSAKRAECRRGHQMSGGNVYIRPSGARQCNACRRISQQALYAAQRFGG